MTGEPAVPPVGLTRTAAEPAVTGRGKPGLSQSLAVALARVRPIGHNLGDAARLAREDDVATRTLSRAGDDAARPPAGSRPVGLADMLRRWWWLELLLVAASLVVGGSVQHAFDQRRAARTLYDIQVLTTASRVSAEEQRQIALPVAQRSAAAFGDVADSINNDLGVNGQGTLDVIVGTGSAATFTQIAFEVTVSSPYASTTFVSWFVRGAGPGGMNSSDIGTCLLSTSLEGSGAATSYLNLASSGLQPCTRDLWSAHQKTSLAPDLALAGIPQPTGS
jgi:hypothetical protein